LIKTTGDARTHATIHLTDLFEELRSTTLLLVSASRCAEFCSVEAGEDSSQLPLRIRGGPIQQMELEHSELERC